MPEIQHRPHCHLWVCLDRKDSKDITGVNRAWVNKWKKEEKGNQQWDQKRPGKTVKAVDSWSNKRIVKGRSDPTCNKIKGQLQGIISQKKNEFWIIHPN